MNPKRFRPIFAGVVLIAAAIATSADPGTQPAVSPPPVITLFEPPASKAGQKLQKVFAEVKFDRAPLADVLNWVRDQADINLVLNANTLNKYGIDLKTPMTLSLRDVTAAEALEVIGRELSDPLRQIWFTAEGNLVILEAGEKRNRAVTKIYDIAGLLRQEHLRRAALRMDPEEKGYADWTTADVVERILTVIQATVAPETWPENGGSTGYVRDINGRLVIAQSPENHRMIEELLAVLRSSGVPPVLPPPPATRPASRPRPAM